MPIPVRGARRVARRRRGVARLLARGAAPSAAQSVQRRAERRAQRARTAACTHALTHAYAHRWVRRSMETVQGWFSGLACCNNLQEARAVEAAAAKYTVTCFDESDTELRDVHVHPTTQWKDMQVTITEIQGAPVCAAPRRAAGAPRRGTTPRGGGCRGVCPPDRRAFDPVCVCVLACACVPGPSDRCRGMVIDAQAMFAYDDGTGVDWPVRNQAVCVCLCECVCACVCLCVHDGTGIDRPVTKRRCAASLSARAPYAHVHINQYMHV